MDGSRFTQDEVRKVGYAIVSLQETTEANSAQKAEFIALTRVLQLGKNLQVNILTQNMGL